MQDVVFLIKAHGSPDLLGRLTRRLDVEWARTIVHVDAKVAIDPFVRAVSARNCSFVADADRVTVCWGGFSIAETTLRLGRLALGTVPAARRLFVLSGQDYPVRPLAILRAAALRTDEFVRVDRALDPRGGGANDMFIRRRYFGNNPWLNQRDARWPLAARVAGLVSRMVRPKLVPGFTIHHGSDWYGLTAEAMRFVLAFYDSRPELIAAFRQVRSPTEMIVQSALMASPFAARIADSTDPDLPSSPEQAHVLGSHFIDWSAGGSHPKTLVLDDLPRIRATGALFARKLDGVASATLMDRLDREDG